MKAQHWRTVLTIFVLVLMVPGMACGLPSPESPPGDDLSALELRQTMAAMQPQNDPSLTVPAVESLPTDSRPAQTEAPGEQATQPAASAQTPTPWQTYPASPGTEIVYYSRSGDTLPALAGRFGVEVDQIIALQPLPKTGYLPLGSELRIPALLEEVTPGDPLLPDSEIVYSPAHNDFDLAAYIHQAGGFLDTFQEVVQGETLSGAAVLQRVADELSVNPRLLVAFLEYRSGWVFGQPRHPDDLSQPIGFEIPDRNGLYQEIMVTATQLNVAYYGWRQGTFTRLAFPDSSKKRLDPTLNPGSVAAQHLLAMFNRPQYWTAAVYGDNGFLALYWRLFGDPWKRAVDPLLPPDLVQPPLELPFTSEYRWALTAGPHNAWNAGTPRGALDFSPITGQPKCQVSQAWVTAASPGLVVRSSYNAVVMDLEADGSEQTGWALVYYHLADHERIPAGGMVVTDQRLGHPSCEGGRATGTHMHLTRKYNGEWLAADNPLPFLLGGWQAFAGELNYQGELVRGEQVVQAKPGGESGSTITRDSP